MIDPARPWSVHTGDCRSILADMDAESVDACVTDTPYGLSTLLDPPNLSREALWRKLNEGAKESPIRTLLRAWLDTGENPTMRGRGFMGKEWDALVPPPNTWRAVWRVLKPGAYNFAFGGTRTAGLIEMSLRLADFEIEDWVSWLYGCLSEDTEIMVNGEWRPWTDAVAGSTVMAYSLEDDTLRPETVQELLVYEYDDVAFHVLGADTDHIVSRNHRCLINDGDWRFAYAEVAPQTCRVPVIEGDDVLRGLWRGDGALPVPHEAYKNADVLQGMQRQVPGTGVGQTRPQGSGGVGSRGVGLVQDQDDGSPESSMARRRYLSSLARQLRWCAVRPDPARPAADGDQNRLHHGAPHGDGATPRPLPDADGGRAPHQPRSVGQPAREPNVVRHESGSQAVRDSRIASASLATVTPVHYRGKVWCVRVPSGAFVARRNGQVFITGNSGMPKRVRLDLKIDEHFGMKEARPVTGRHMSGSSAGMQHLGPSGIKGGAYESHGAATPEAARHVGWDRASRPAWEPVIVACKPLRGTIAETALWYGTGGMNADGCRIPRVMTDIRERRYSSTHYNDPLGDSPRMSCDLRGGFPANVIISEEVAAELDRQSGVMRDGVAVKRNTEVGKVTGRIFQLGNTGKDATFGGGGGASRFFYTAKASTSERDKGLEDLPVLTPGVRSGGREEGSAGINGYAGTRGEKGRNPHPTVKPISLMRYLVRRACPPGAWDPDPAARPLVLDCFMGSGSTGVACMAEGVRFVGCELDPQSAEVARLRLQHAYALPREETEDAAPTTRPGGQVTLF